MEEYILARITVRSKILWILYSKYAFGLFCKYSFDKEIHTYIDNNAEGAFSEAIQKDDDGYYILNICSVDYISCFGSHNELPKDITDHQLMIYAPLLQKFIVDAGTRTLEKEGKEIQRNRSFEEEIIARIEVRGKILIVVYNKCLPGLYKSDTSDEEIRDYIRNNTEEAFSTAVQKHKDGYYILNIASVDNLGSLRWTPFAKNLLNGQLEIYHPLIQKFIVDAYSRTLK